MEIDYLIATGFFIAVFAFAVMFVSNNVFDQKESIISDITKERADLAMNRILSENDSISLVSPLYKLYVYAENNNATVQELIQVDLNKFGKNDPNSVIIVDSDNKTYRYYVFGNTILFSSLIQGFSTKRFIMYFDDDSNFTSTYDPVSGNDTIKEVVYGPEKIYAIKYNLLNKLANSNLTEPNMHISVITGNKTLLNYGPYQEGRKNVIVKRKPMLIQTEAVILKEGWLIVSSW